MGARILARLVLLGLALACAWPASSHAQVPVAAWQSSQWWRNCASLDLDFYNDQYYVNSNTTCDGTVGTTYSGAAYGTNLTNFISGVGATFTRASTATYFNSSGVLSTAATNTPRLDHDPVSFFPKGVLIEEARTNIQTNSGTNWGAAVNGTAATGSVYGPDGVTPLELITPTAPGNRIQSSGAGLAITAGTTYTWSVYASPGTSQYLGIGAYANGGTGQYSGAIFNLSGAGSYVSSAGTVSSYGIIQVGPSLYRAWITFTIPSGNTKCQFFAGSSDGSTYSSGVYPTASSTTINVGFVQAEAGAFPTSYIPTSGSTATRGNEVFSIPVGSWYQSSAGTFTADHYGNGANAVNSRIIGSNNATAFIATYGASYLQSYDGTAITTSTVLNMTTTSPIRSAFAWSTSTNTRSLTGGRLCTCDRIVLHRLRNNEHVCGFGGLGQRVFCGCFDKAHYLSPHSPA
jgi:hypothetical protein